MLPDVDSLALFVKAAETRNLTRAAEACFITVPAASRRLSLLEHQFKVQVFERHSRGLQLTPAGEHLLNHARAVIAAMNLMRAEMLNYALGRNVVLKIVGNTSAMAQFLPADVAAFQNRHQEVRIVLEEAWSEEVVRRVTIGEADLGIIIEGSETANLWLQPYRVDQLVAVFSAHHEVTETPLDFEALLAFDLIGLEGGSMLTKLLMEKARQALRTMALRVQVRSFEALCRSIQSGLGIGIMPLAVAQGFALSMNLKICPLSNDWAMRRMQICTRTPPQSDSPLDLLSRHLINSAV